MEQFERKRESVPADMTEATQRPTANHETAEQLLDSVAVTDAFAETVGDSDELLVNLLESELDGQLLVAAHSEADGLTPIYEAYEGALEATRLSECIAAFPIVAAGLTS